MYKNCGNLPVTKEELHTNIANIASSRKNQEGERQGAKSDNIDSSGHDAARDGAYPGKIA